MGLFDLTGRTVCVLGGGGYLSGPACIALAEQGAYVVVADLRLEAAQTVLTEINEAGGRGEAVAIDVGDEAAVVALFDRIAQEQGSLDGVVNATFFYRNLPMAEMSMEVWREGMRINLDAAFLVSREAGRIMAAQGRGSIVQFSSMYGNVAPDPSIYENMPPNPVHYGAAKAGVVQLVKYQAAMYGRQGVRVNAIAPGPFPFKSMQEDDPGFAKRLAGKTMLGRIGDRPEIAGAVVYLVSDASSFVTGTQLMVDGGWCAW